MIAAMPLVFVRATGSRVIVNLAYISISILLSRLLISFEAQAYEGAGGSGVGQGGGTCVVDKLVFDTHPGEVYACECLENIQAELCINKQSV